MEKMKCTYILWVLFIIYFIISPFRVKAKGMDDICILEKGTLVIAVPSKEGLVVCADKRVHYIETNITKDEKIKIIQVGDHGLFASVGSLSFTRTVKFDPNPIYIEVDRIVENYFKKKDIRTFTNEQWNDFCQYLEKIFKADNYTQIQSDDSNKPFLQVAFFYLDLKNSINRTVVQLFIKKEKTPFLSGSGIQITFKTDPDHIIKNSIKLLGEAAVITEVMYGTNPHFDDVRRNPLVQKALSTQAIPLGQFTLLEAKDFASYLIEITSKRSNLIPGFKGHVSPTCDCAILDFKDGFRWINK